MVHPLSGLTLGRAGRATLDGFEADPKPVAQPARPDLPRILDEECELTRTHPGISAEPAELRFGCGDFGATSTSTDLPDEPLNGASAEWLDSRQGRPSHPLPPEARPKS